MEYIDNYGVLFSAKEPNYSFRCAIDPLFVLCYAFFFPAHHPRLVWIAHTGRVMGRVRGCGLVFFFFFCRGAVLNVASFLRISLDC